ncbi:hypothetical protein QFZ24_009989 [Streptomyces phaeochromogenes]|jgi:hypothetical protein|uniref:hypothetical protein n=1 Tax=Streptomyces phaeochromogenes TaxID=1923 RepID=UPI00278E1B00|nr:hypothetical protein [Streptomyces phaeochromogenes]MDQ0955980.1 hypothetical protein [Streptomyces phaeochromogenes]
MYTHTMTPAARSRYDAYVEHLRTCRECPAGAGRCTAGAALVRSYLEAVQEQLNSPCLSRG